jgi:hypothetical protein
VFDPAGLGKYLLMLLLGYGNDPPGMVEHDKSGAGRSLIDGA